jgi:peptidoglycan/xylan/chitin deacetylase (PgdA/CDA1 family)
MHITFDDGPHPTFTPAMLEVLERFDARATFFLIGEHVEAFPDVVEAILAQGSTVGNHTLTHSIRPGTPGMEERYLAEVAATSEILSSVAGRRPTAFRPPWGRHLWASGSTVPPMADAVAELGLRLWLWDAECEDWEHPQPSADELLERLVTAMEAPAVPASGSEGWVVLLHDGVPGGESGEGRTREASVSVLERLLERHGRDGVEFTPLPGS